MSVTAAQPMVAEELRRRLEKLSRHYDVETMKVFMVVEGVGEGALHAVYSSQRRPKWQAFLKRHEACRLDLARHDKTRERYNQFLREVGREDQGRQWFQALLHMLHDLGAADIFHYVTAHSAHPTPRTHNPSTNPHPQHGGSNPFRSPRRYEPHRHSFLASQRLRESDVSQAYRHADSKVKDGVTLTPRPQETSSVGGVSNGFCGHLSKLFEKKLEAWFESFQAVAVRLTAHVKVSGLVRVLSGQVNALCTRQGRLHALAIKVTAQDTPRPLDVAELCLAKVMVIQNGLALPEDLDLGLLTLHVHPSRPVLRLWLLTPSAEMETAIRLADIDDMIDAGRLSQFHELWADNTTTDTLTLAPSVDGYSARETSDAHNSHRDPHQ